MKKIKSWENEFDERFAIGKGRCWFLTEVEAKEIKSFIRQTISQELEEFRKKIEALQIKRTKERHNRQNDRGNYRDNGWNEATHAILNILKLDQKIKKALEERKEKK